MGGQGSAGSGRWQTSGPHHLVLLHMGQGGPGGGHCRREGAQRASWGVPGDLAPLPQVGPSGLPRTAPPPGLRLTLLGPGGRSGHPARPSVPRNCTHLRSPWACLDPGLLGTPPQTGLGVGGGPELELPPQVTLRDSRLYLVSLRVLTGVSPTITAHPGRMGPLQPGAGSHGSQPRKLPAAAAAGPRRVPTWLDHPSPSLSCLPPASGHCSPGWGLWAEGAVTPRFRGRGVATRPALEKCPRRLLPSSPLKFRLPPWALPVTAPCCAPHPPLTQSWVPEARGPARAQDAGPSPALTLQTQREQLEPQAAHGPGALRAHGGDPGPRPGGVRGSGAGT